MAQFSSLYSDALTQELGTDDASVLFTTARRKHAVNEGQRQFADLTECAVKQSSITVSSGGREFNLLSSVLTGSSAAPFLRVSRQGPVYLVNDTSGNLQQVSGDLFPQRDVAWLDAAQPGWRSTNTGTPSAWYMRPDAGANYFGLNCPADVSTSETAQLLIPYVVNPSSMTSDTSIPFSFANVARTDLVPYHQALVHWAASDLEKLRKDVQASDRQLQKFLGYVQRYIAEMKPKGPRSLRTSRSYFREARRVGEVGSPIAPWWR